MEADAAPAEGEAATAAEGDSAPAEGDAAPAEGDAAPAVGEVAPAAEDDAAAAEGDAAPAEGDAAPAEGDAAPVEEDAAPAGGAPALPPEAEALAAETYDALAKGDPADPSPDTEAASAVDPAAEATKLGKGVEGAEKGDLDKWAEGLGDPGDKAATKAQAGKRERGGEAAEEAQETKQNSIDVPPEMAPISPLSSTLHTDRSRAHEESDDIEQILADRCMDERQFDDIVQECLRNGVLYEDDMFPASSESLFKDPNGPVEYSLSQGSSSWRRAEKFREAVIFPETRPCADCCVGDVPDLWLANAATCISCRPDLIAHNFYSSQYFRDAGMVCVRLFREGKWRHIALDTSLPFHDSDAKTPANGRCVNKEEIWFPLLEKAFAKFVGTYEDLMNHGSVGGALVDMTGGCQESYDLPIDGSEPYTWTTIKNWFAQGDIMCVMAEQEKARLGIQPDHAYAIIDVAEIENMQLLRIRNGWESEWKGAMGDHDPLWQKHDLKDKLRYEFGSDGTFWMRFEEFNVFSTIIVCRLFPPSYHRETMPSMWHGLSAAGAPLAFAANPSIPQGITPDPDHKFFLNPQFRIQISRPTHLYISLVQSDLNPSGYQSVNMLLVKGKSLIWDLNEADIVGRIDFGDKKKKQREITVDIQLQPKDGLSFVLICYQDTPKPDTKKTRFYIRTFSSEPLTLERIPSPHVITLESSWQERSAGGPRQKAVKDGKVLKENYSWCKNPQFTILSAKANQIKVILDRQVGRKRHGATPATVGFTVTRLQSSPDENSASRSRAQRKAAAKTSSDTESKLPPIKRKLSLLPNEWVQETSFAQEDTACMFLSLNKGFGPLTIIPSLSEEGIFGNFSLHIYSERPLSHAVTLPEKKHQIEVGSWTAENTGGCHLFSQSFETKTPTWQRNPVFTLSCPQKSQAKITLARSERRWASMIAKDAVGCMIGFYVIQGDISRDNVIVETTFVPTHEISYELSLSPGVKYSIMPCTYEVNKIGDFILGVSCNDDFILE